ncbi:VOC family protein [Longimicrobium terrae]|uniref:Catechol 2,3-dioxygenase-like lactoylglutathione lyase family enzyme n=1 Tax=Longimicrobium terrae TaxID=1639882 RepID=A0A841H5J6_9BACT|nr:VOC family protein [Longimicrobium terrae]MBB4639042.1 catechol 2,3-dioxygenase-like lactoylglutathione lyase family enzyme [Longimicrobium terrae]MBB6073357.1 catechol 2,3-dioxygenase-like lactoylglutathione lyase family enzyme [Longimicrobium terrae]NNC28795.1 glyoxalase [Longimicrobium terrae]
MADPTGTTRITTVGTVFVPVADQDRALAFYVDTLGFQLRGDLPYSGGRWVEVAPPGSANVLALVPPSEGRAAATDQTICAFGSTDIDADYATLRARGIDMDAEIGRAGTSRPGLIALDARISDPQPPQFSFRDPDGNRFLIVQAPPAA